MIGPHFASSLALFFPDLPPSRGLFYICGPKLRGTVFLARTPMRHGRTPKGRKARRAPLFRERGAPAPLYFFAPAEHRKAHFRPVTVCPRTQDKIWHVGLPPRRTGGSRQPSVHRLPWRLLAQAPAPRYPFRQPRWSLCSALPAPCFPRRFVQRIHQSAKLALGAAQLVFQRQQVHLLFALLGQVSCCLYGRVPASVAAAPLSLSNVVISSTSLILPVLLEL